ncbi:hypothetical protein HanHA300_Chr01g0028581 [Helianthus annuus]|nr:hypothetical protein HanHA300_Chr01g0028581 [Helianthus annuus]
MGKKGHWFSAIKKVFTHNSKDKSSNETEKKNSNEKKGRGKLKHGESRSFIPLFREPSSIEKILGKLINSYCLLVILRMSSNQQPHNLHFPASPPRLGSLLKEPLLLGLLQTEPLLLGCVPLGRYPLKVPLRELFVSARRLTIDPSQLLATTTDLPP